MIQINDNDLPITVAEKIIHGTKPFIAPAFIKALRRANDLPEEMDEDMFTLDEIREIADYLMVYCNSHEKGD